MNKKKIGGKKINDRNTASNDLNINLEELNNSSKNYYMTHACQESFTCANCGKLIQPEGAGTDHRNQCPYCLHSLHLDNVPGDRASNCHGLMKPIAVWVRKNGEWAIIHKCTKCNKISSNRVAADDNPMKLMALAMKPLVSNPLDKERLKKMLDSMNKEA